MFERARRRENSHLVPKRKRVKRFRSEGALRPAVPRGDDISTRGTRRVNGVVREAGSTLAVAPGDSL